MNWNRFFLKITNKHVMYNSEQYECLSTVLKYNIALEIGRGGNSHFTMSVRPN